MFHSRPCLLVPDFRPPPRPHYFTTGESTRRTFSPSVRPLNKQQTNLRSLSHASILFPSSSSFSRHVTPRNNGCVAAIGAAAGVLRVRRVVLRPERRRRGFGAAAEGHLRGLLPQGRTGRALEGGALSRELLQVQKSGPGGRQERRRLRFPLRRRKAVQLRLMMKMWFWPFGPFWQMCSSETVARD